MIWDTLFRLCCYVAQLCFAWQHARTLFGSATRFVAVNGEVKKKKEEKKEVAYIEVRAPKKKK